MSILSLLLGDASGWSMPKVADPLATSKELIPQWLFRKGCGGS